MSYGIENPRNQSDIALLEVLFEAYHAAIIIALTIPDQFRQVNVTTTERLQMLNNLSERSSTLLKIISDLKETLKKNAAKTKKTAGKNGGKATAGRAVGRGADRSIAISGGGGRDMYGASGVEASLSLSSEMVDDEDEAEGVEGANNARGNDAALGVGQVI